MAMHGDMQLVDRIIEMKTRNHEYKEHPDSPGDTTALLYYVLVDLEKLEEDEHEDKLLMEISGEASGEQADHNAPTSAKAFTRIVSQL